LRKKKSNPAEDLLELVSMFPWWVGVVLAVVAYFVLHRLAAPAPAAVTAFQPSQMADLVTRSIWTALATVGQYLIPLICLGGAGVSAWKRYQRKTLVADVAQAKGADVLNGMSWQKFEMLVGEAFRLQGFGVTETGGGGADGGVDLVLSKGSEKFLVQCKQWKAYKVGVDVVRELYGVMAARGAAGGFVVTSGSFTTDANAFAEGKNVKLVDGARLFGLIQQAKRSVAGRPALAAQGSDVAPPVATVSAVACPICQSTMIKRTAKKGAHAGSQFWGCASFPACKGTRPIG